MYAPSLRKDEFFKIHIKHLATSNKVDFEGWVTEFADNFSSTWNETSVYGRMDPLATFQNTKRDIKLSFDVVSDSKEDARTNLIRINKLISFLYPVYEKSSRGVQNTLNAAPLIGLKWTNLINNAMGGEELIGYIDGINYAPDMGEGGFIIAETDKTFVPKKVSISFGFKVLHTHMVGWNGGSFGDSLYGKFPNADYAFPAAEPPVEPMPPDEAVIPKIDIKIDSIVSVDDSVIAAAIAGALSGAE